MKFRADLIGAVALAGCGAADGSSGGAAARVEPALKSTVAPVAYRLVDTPVKIGKVYRAAGISYTPSDDAHYDEVGYASWYGDELAGSRTANGERFNPKGISAAHRTLPMPSYIEVTSLETGRRILVRVNDRGPFSGKRVIDLSHGAARQLGISGQGHFAVHVRRVDPEDFEEAALRSGKKAVERARVSPEQIVDWRDRLRNPGRHKAVRGDAETPVSVPDPRGQIMPTFAPLAFDTAPAHQGTRWHIQLGAFTDWKRAEALAARSGASIARSDGVYRVRYGPFNDQRAVNEALRSASARGYSEAVIIRSNGTGPHNTERSR